MARIKLSKQTHGGRGILIMRVIYREEDNRVAEAEVFRSVSQL